MKILNEDDEYLKNYYKERKQSRISKYRKYAQIDNDTEITEENLDEWALNKVANLNFFSPDRLREELLSESLCTEKSIGNDINDKVKEKNNL